jgi:hypothetical protein
MAQLLRFWLGLCLLRVAPQDLPASRWLLGFSIICYATVSVLAMTLSYGFADGVRVALLELGLLAVFVSMLLYLLNKPARIGQTLSALTGAGALLGLPALLLVIVAAPESGTAQSVSVAWLLLLIWNLLVTAHIMRHALSSSLAIGLGVSLLYTLVSTQFIMTSFPQLAGQ